MAILLFIFIYLRATRFHILSFQSRFPLQSDCEQSEAIPSYLLTMSGFHCNQGLETRFGFSFSLLQIYYVQEFFFNIAFPDSRDKLYGTPQILFNNFLKYNSLKNLQKSVEQKIQRSLKIFATLLKLHRKQQNKNYLQSLLLSC